MTLGITFKTPVHGDIDPLSCLPLYLDLYAGRIALASATGFLVRHQGQTYLITNWHVVTGRHPITLEWLSSSLQLQPDRIEIWHHSSAYGLGSWTCASEPLINSETLLPMWLEHPDGHLVDVVALRLTAVAGLQYHVLDLSLADANLYVGPSEQVSIIGYPEGMTSRGKFPIWKTGHIASDISLDYGGRSLFLIDATTKCGMSGSPVIAKRVATHISADGKTFMQKSTCRFLGVYAGREKNAEIGRVWKPSVIHAIIEAADVG